PNPLVQLAQCGYRSIRECVPVPVEDTRGVAQYVFLHHVSDQIRPVKQFMAAEGARLERLGPVGTVLGCQLAEPPLAILLQFRDLARACGHVHSSIPACRRILFKVPRGRSSESLPGTVTLPDLLGCRNCLWLPFWAIWTHPSAVSRRITSRTFIVRL